MSLLRPAGPNANPRRFLLRYCAAALAFLLMAGHPLLHAFGLTQRPYHSFWTFLGAILAGIFLLHDWARIRLGNPAAARAESVRTTVRR